MPRYNTTINVSNWQYNLLAKEVAKCTQARDIISNFLDEMRKIAWDTVDFDVNGNRLFTTFLGEGDLEFMRKLKQKKIFFSLSEIARIAFWEHYRQGLFEAHIKKEYIPQPDYLERNNITVVRRLEY